jgi:ribose 5-phosphate isomerase A
LRKVAATTTLRTTSHGAPFVTDGGHYILDCAFDGINDPAALQRQLDGTIGVVEHGLFVGLVSRVIVGGPSGVRTIERAGPA